MGRGEAEELGEPLPVGRVDGDPFLQEHAELAVEREVVVGLLLGQRVEPVEHPFDEGVADPADDRVVLQGLARDVQRQVLGIDQAVEEPEVLGHQLAAVVLDEDPLHAEVQPMLRASEPEQLDVGGRAVEDRAELDRRVGRQVEVPERLLLGVVGQVLVELGVLLLGHLALGLDPDRLLVVDDLAADLDRVRHEARILPQRRLDPPLVEELLGRRP